MELLNLELMAVTVVVLLAFWAVVGYRHFKRLKKSVEEQWETVYMDLRKRNDIVPLLIETVRNYDKNQEELMQKLITLRPKASKLYEPSAEKVEAELNLSALINEIFDLGRENKDLRTDTTFLEVGKEIDDLEKNLEERVGKYNDMVRYYNSHLRMFILAPVAMIFGFKKRNIFEVEK